MTRVVLLIVLASAMVGLPPAADGTAPHATTFTGTILDAQGRPVADARIDIAVPEPGPGGGFTEAVFASTHAARDGSYSVTAAVPATAVASSPVEVLVTATFGDDAVHHNLLLDPQATDVRRSDGPKASRSDGSSSYVALSLQIGHGAVAYNPASRTATTLSSVVDGAVEHGPNGPDPDDDEPIWERRGTSSCPQTYATFWAPELAVRKRRYVPVQRVTARSHSTHTYEWETTKNTTLQVAITGDGGNYSGGLTGSKENSVGLGMRMNVGNRDSKVLKVEWEFMRFRKKCLSACHSCGSDFYLDVFQWRPHRRTSGSQRVDNDPTWACDRRTTVRMANETWVARSSNVVWRGFFSIGGVRLDAAQENSASHRLSVKPDAGERDARVCGDIDYPLYAHRVRERRD